MIPKGPLGMFGIARSQLERIGYNPLEASDPMGEPMSGGGGGGGFGFSLGGRSNDPFHPDNFPTKLDPTQGPSYGLPSIWNPEYSIAETNAWANSMKTNKDIPQFMQNTFTDPMAERMGKGVYHMDVSNPNNRPSDLTGKSYTDRVAATKSWRDKRTASKAANIMGGSGSSRSRGSRRGRSRPSKPSPGFGFSRRSGGR